MNNNKTLKIIVEEQIEVSDVFLFIKKKIRTIKRGLTYFVCLVRSQVVVTLSWAPLLARCPADSIATLNYFLTVAAFS